MNGQLTNLEIAVLAQEDKYRQQVEMMRKIYKPAGFVSYYFEELPKYKTAIECFNAVNGLHVELFGEEKYASYVSFQNEIRRRLRHEK